MISPFHQPRPWFQFNLKDPALNASARWVCSQLKDLFSWVDTCIVIDEKLMCERFSCTSDQLQASIDYMVSNHFLAVEKVDGYFYLFRSQKRFGIFARRANNRPRPPADNYVYLMRDHSNGLTKIGRSNNPDVREKTLRSETPYIEMIGCFEADCSAEKTLHFKYASKRKRGEWFNLNDSDVQSILEQTEVDINSTHVGVVPPAGFAIPKQVTAGFWIEDAVKYRKRLYGWWKTAHDKKKDSAVREENRIKSEAAFAWFESMGCTVIKKEAGKVSVKFPKA